MSTAFKSQSTDAETTAILRFLFRLRRKHLVQTYAGLIGGAMISLLGPLCILLTYLLFSMTLIASYGFWGAYLRVAAVTLPLFFLLAYWLRGSVLERWVPDGDTLSGRFMRRWIAPTLVILEIANSGPRMMIWAMDRLIGQHRVSGTPLPRIAQGVSALLKTDSSISPAALLLPGEPADQLELLLGFLLYYQIVDLSKQGDRVWIMSHQRRELEQMMTQPRGAR
jgi:hypothetical protein